MAFCDFSDLFGKFRKKKKTRFTDLETTAKELLGKFVRGEIGNKEFADAFNNVGKRLNELPDFVIASPKNPHQRV